MKEIIRATNYSFKPKEKQIVKNKRKYIKKHKNKKTIKI